jgi:23S rRNA pseudouridine1911/1915/1917 synthase
VNGQPVKPSFRLERGQQVRVQLPAIRTFRPEPENIPVDIIYEDEFLIAVNKEPGMIVHPARGHMAGTLVNALLHHAGVDLPDAGDDVPRPGIVHRLDQYTSGVIVLALRQGVYENLAQQFEHRTVQKEYLALVEGVPELDSDHIEAPIGRNIRDPERMAIRHDGQGKDALTFYQVEQRFRAHALLRCRPRTGRTHQIRVHLAWIGHPCVADAVYGRRKVLRASDILPADQVPPGDEVLLDRQALHAHRLTFTHPNTGTRMTLEAPLPPDLRNTLDRL